MHRLGVADGTDLAATLAAYPFLAGYFTTLLPHMPEGTSWEDGWQWWEAAIDAWERSGPAHLPLRALADQGGLDFRARVALLLIGLGEEDSRFGTLFARLQEPLAPRRPSLEFVGQVLSNDPAAAAIDDVCRPLLRAGLVEVSNPDAPRAEWLPRVPAALWEVLRGVVEAHPAPGCLYYPPESFPTTDALIFPPAFLAQLAQVPALVREARARAIILRGMSGSDRLQVLGALARALGWGVLAVEAPAGREGEPGGEAIRPGPALGPLCAMLHALPALTYELAPGETAVVPAPAGYNGPLGVLTGLEWG